MGIINIINKLKSILSSNQKCRILQLSIMMVLGGILETLSVSLIMPFMNVAMNANKSMDTWYVKLICNIFRISSTRELLIVFAVLLACLYVFKNAYLMAQYFLYFKFVYNNMFELQNRLLKAFIHRPYGFFLQVNSGEIIRIINGDTAAAFQVLITVLQMCTELVVAIMLTVTIFVITPMITICIAVILLILMLFIFKIIKPVLRRAGVSVQEAGTGMNKWMIQSIQGIKELKVMRKEEFFEENFNKYGLKYIYSMRWNNTLNQAPRFIIEAVCMGVMFIIVAVLIYQGVVLESIIPALTAVAMAAMRLLPSVNRISVSLNNIAYSEPMLDKVIENLEIFSEKEKDYSFNEIIVPLKKNDSLEFLNEIRLDNITFRYPDGDNNVLTSASLVIRYGESVGIVGKSGAGKTTLVDIILGILTPQYGQVIVDGVDVSKNISRWLDNIGYIPQMIFMLDDTIRANVAFGDKDVNENEVWRAIKEAALDEFVKSLPLGLDTEIGERGVRLSGGQRQRIGIARALYRDPSILIFDEATSALDNHTESTIMESIDRLHGKKTIIIIAHRLSTIEMCDHVYKIEEEKIVRER